MKENETKTKYSCTKPNIFCADEDRERITALRVSVKSKFYIFKAFWYKFRVFREVSIVLNLTTVAIKWPTLLLARKRRVLLVPVVLAKRPHQREDSRGCSTPSTGWKRRYG